MTNKITVALVLAAAILAAVFLGLGLVRPAHSAEAARSAEQACNWSEQYEAAKAKGWVQVEVFGGDKDRFLANYNALEPVTDYHPDHIWAAQRSDRKELVSVAFVTGNCVDLGDELTIEDFLDLLTRKPQPPGHPV